MFIYCFDKETQDYLIRHGFQQLNPDASVPYIFYLSSTVSLESLSEIKGRYVLTNEMLYFT